MPQLALALASLLSMSEAARGGLLDNFDTGSLLQTRLSVEPQLEQMAVSGGSRGSSRKYIQRLVNFADLQYIVNYKLGGQTISGILDTGSFDLLVFPHYCSSCGSAGMYDPAESSTHELGIYSMSQTYGSGATVSFEAFEQVLIGNYESSHQIFWEVQSANMPVLETASFSSIIGLGPPETSAADAWLGAEESVDRILRHLNNSESKVATSLSAAADLDITAAISMTRKPALVRSLGIDSFSLCLGYKMGSDGYIVWNDDSADRMPGIFHELPLVGQHTWSISLTEPHLSFEQEFGFLLDKVQREKAEKVNATPFLDALESARQVYDKYKPPVGSNFTKSHFFGESGDGFNITRLMVDTLNKVPLAPTLKSGLIDAFSPLGCSKGCSALLDSGTSLLVMPASMIYRIQTAMEALGVNCSDLGKLPDLVITLGDVTLSLPPDSYLAKQAAGVIPTHLQGLVRAQTISAAGVGANKVQENDHCRLMIMESTATTQHGELFILGMPFFRKYYTTFTYGETRESRKVQVARAGDGCVPVADTPLLNHILNRTVPHRELDFQQMYVPRSVQAAHTQKYVRV